MPNVAAALLGLLVLLKIKNTHQMSRHNIIENNKGITDETDAERSLVCSMIVAETPRSLSLNTCAATRPALVATSHSTTSSWSIPCPDRLSLLVSSVRIDRSLGLKRCGFLGIVGREFQSIS